MRAACMTVVLLAVLSCGSRTDQASHVEVGADSDGVVEVTGPHGGRLLTEGDLSLEVVLFERGVSPELRVYAFENGHPIDPGSVDLTVSLRRFGGRVDEMRFATRDGYLLGNRTVAEPHSFRIEVAATHRGAAHRWTYDSWEGRTEMSPEAVAASAISIEEVGPAAIRTSITVNGRIVPNEEHLAHVVPRYAGVVRDVRKRLGDVVMEGEVVATVESNQSLRGYDVRSPIAGTVIAKEVLPGEFAREGEAILTVADLRTVWADLRVPSEESRAVAVGQLVAIDAGRGVAPIAGAIAYLSPVSDEDTQTLLARAVIPNPTGAWRPGLFVTGTIVVDEAQVPVSVAASALQTYRGWDVVFLNEGRVFQAMPVEIGRRDRDRVEITDGLDPGQRYAAANSFVVKADIEKSGASHDH